ncbi:hypothetical protein OGAPHI_006070 [Ogataea philodendri]|uniref:CCZ1/INTU/HSP4 first Longin domain-containing protein n=1 Tax=Ogataea philodendri TaxID=1378263 RepID=A0A9P8T0V9_9ASCO|nr:uncharacterized protein OGAPHI_006070 [Ogataea philodendri]KAH3661891.1 hypothetical protein OGAPHI_006070 [Ogataea philodendri]
MNVFSAIQTSTSNLISKGSSSTTSDWVAPKLLYFCIFDPTLADPKKEDDQQLINQILVYLNFEDREVTNSEKAKRIGFIEGLGDFSGRFSACDSGYLNYIDTDKSRVIVGTFAEKYKFFCGFRFAQLAENYVRRGLASPEYMINEFQSGYNLYYINHGAISYETKEQLEKWWEVWLNHKFEFESGYNLEDRGLLNLYPGYRCSSVVLPIGFQENLKNAMERFVDQKDGLVDLVVLNTNWTPCKNFGVVYLNKESKVPSQWLTNLVNYIEKLDLSIGLSTYSLKSDNLPSLKAYHAAVQAAMPQNNGTLLDRSILQPAIYLHEQLTTHVFNPFTSALSTVSTVPQLLPSFSMFGLGSTSNEETEVAEETVSDISEQVQESLTTQKTGKYLLGNTSEGIVTKNIHLGDHSLELVVYEINGILFALFYDNLDHDEHVFNALQNDLDNLYALYFNDLVINQLKSIEKEIKTETSFFYLIHDPVNNVLKTSIPNIADSEEVRELKTYHVPSAGLSRSQMINLTMNLMTYLLEKTSPLELKPLERIIKINSNWWCLQKLVNGKTVVALKKFASGELKLDAGDLVSSFGPEFRKWYHDSIKSGFI